MKKKVIALILSMVAMTSVVSCYGKEVKARDEEMFVVVQDNWDNLSNENWISNYVLKGDINET